MLNLVLNPLLRGSILRGIDFYELWKVVREQNNEVPMIFCGAHTKEVLEIIHIKIGDPVSKYLLPNAFYT